MPSGEESSITSTSPRRAVQLAHARERVDHALEVLALVVGRARRRGSGRTRHASHLARIQAANAAAGTIQPVDDSPAQRRDRRPVRPARRSLRAGRRRRLPRAGLPQGGEALPRDRRVGLGALGAGPPDRARRHRRHDRDEGRASCARRARCRRSRSCAAACPRASSRSCACPGLGAKTARRLWQELGITTLAELEAAARAGRLHELQGFGERKERQLLAQLEAGAAPRKRVFRLDQALELARTVLEPLRAHPACERADEAGSLRRRAETVGDVDVIAAATDGPGADGLARRAAVRRRGARPRHHQGLGADAQRRAARPARRAARELRQPAAALHGLEGPQRAHARGRPAARHERLGVGHRGRRERRGLPHAATRTRSTATSATSRSRPSCARTTASSSSRGATSCPSSSSSPTCAATCTSTATGADGKHSLLDLVEAAQARGHDYIAITDHSAGVGMGIGLEADDVRRQIEAVQRIRETLDGLRAAGRLRGRHHGRRVALPARRPAGRARLGRRLAARRAAAGPRPHHEAAAGGRRASRASTSSGTRPAA